MRTILFFDLPTLTNVQKSSYRHFVKALKKNGFYMIEESVYVKMSIDSYAATSSIEKVKEFLPKEGIVMALNITEKQFSSMKVLLGESITDVINNDERVIEL